MTGALAVAVGGVAGAVARYLVGESLEGEATDTLAVNVLGSLLLGAVVAAPVSDTALLALGTGFCGAFTTFSSFAVELVQFGERGDHCWAAVYAVGTFLAALVAVAVGAAIGATLA